MKQTPRFVEPILDSTRSSLNPEYLDRSVEQYAAGNYKEAFHLLLDYLNDTIRPRFGNADGTEFRIPHGSILVCIRIDDGKLSIRADFLTLPAKQRTAMLRQVADLTLNRLMLSRFRKEGDKLRMEYECPLSQSHPHKLFFILRNICHVGDRYDDEFCTKFGAERCYEPRVTPYPEAETARIVEAMRTVCTETLDAVKDYEAARRYGYAWNVLDTAFYRIAYFAQPQGQLRNELEQAVDDMDRELPVTDLVAKGRAFLEKLRDTPGEALAADLYFTDTLVSTRRRSSLANVQENMRDVWREADEAMQNRDFERSAVRILYKFYEMYFYNDVQDDLNDLVRTALRSSAGLPAEEASEILFEAIDRIMEGDLGDGGAAGGTNRIGSLLHAGIERLKERLQRLLCKEE